MLDFGGLHHTRRLRNTLVHRADLYRAEPEAKIESNSVRHSFRSASVIRNVYEHMYIGIACKLCACWRVKAAIQRIPFFDAVEFPARQNTSKKAEGGLESPAELDKTNVTLRCISVSVTMCKDLGSRVHDASQGSIGM